MVLVTTRRKSHPFAVQQIWAAIASIRQQKQISNMERISRYMAREYNMKISEAQIQTRVACEDGLVESYTAVGVKGSRTGLEQEGFKLADMSDFDRGEHDWYCFNCHGPGEVICCGSCHRVFHTKCVKEFSTTDDKLTCIICQAAKQKPKRKRKELNRLLSFTVMRMKEKARDLYKLFWKTEESSYLLFVFKPCDLNIMEDKCGARKYRHLEQFEADAKTLYHNVVICYGENGVMAQLAKGVLEDCKYDLNEIRQCKDCYYYSNTRPVKEWFAEPCRPPHELVYAKQKGFSHWPAKVISSVNDKYDVRFFGGKHQRAVVPHTSVKPIDTPFKQMTIKKSAAFSKSMDELKLHQQLLEELKAHTEQLDGAESDEIDADDEEDIEAHVKISTNPPIKLKQTIIEEFEEEEQLIKTPPKMKLKRRLSQDHSKPAAKLAKKAKSSYSLEDEDGISSSVLSPERSLPEDVNVVTSSEDSSQLRKKFTSLKPCNCEVKLNKLKNLHAKELNHALEELTAKLELEFEKDKQQAVSRAMGNMTRELERVRRQTEERCKEQYMEEMRILQQKHKTDISETKKRQWCCNCEKDAIYHCCWNTSYCSNKCQQEHWHSEHKRCCRRKR